MDISFFATLAFSSHAIMTNNTLIVYKSRYGTTAQCANELFHLLNGKVDMCNLSDRKHLPDLSNYDTVVIGGSIHYGKIQKEIVDFYTQQIQTLRDKRLGLFINCLYSGEKAIRQLDTAFPHTLFPQVVVRDFFGGELPFDKMNFWERLVTKSVIQGEKMEVKLSKKKIKHFAERLNNES